MAVVTSSKHLVNLFSKERSVFTKTDLFWLLPFLVAAIFPVLWQLSSLPVLQWDEARLAVNAAEMVDNGNWIVTHFYHEPDMWNCKPPLQIWLIALSIKAFGYSELAVRLPTVLAVLSTFGLIFWFCLRVFKSKMIAALSVLVLVSSRSYMAYHVARNADYDALLVFCITLYTVSFFLYLEEFKRKHFWLCILGLTLAVLTKGIAGLMCAPVLLVYIIYRGKLLYLLKQKDLYIGIAVFLFFSLGYYFLREQINPGYLQAVYDNELGGRFLTTLESHLHPWNWYLENMRNDKYTWWFYFVPLSVWVLCWQPAAQVRRFTVLGILFLAIFLTVISSAQTKLYWYDAPVYPIAAILIAMGLTYIMQAVSHYFAIRKASVFQLVSVLLICGMPYYQVLDHYIYDRSNAPLWFWESMFGPSLKFMDQNYPQYKNVTFFQDSLQYKAASHFYKIAYIKKGYAFKEVDQKSVKNLKPDEIVVVCQPELHLEVEKLYRVEILYNHHFSRVFRILEKKNPINKKS